MASAESMYPEICPFVYVHIPADETKPVEEILFQGNSEKELRKTIEQHFHQTQLSENQRNEMIKHIVEKAEENSSPQSLVTTKMKDEDREGDKSKKNNEQTINSHIQSELVDKYLNHGSFEIVPITMPTFKSKYIGISLYIDDSGSFKELSVNSRASTLAQRKICGDAYLLANHDDPALEQWQRVDCTLDMYQKLHDFPPKTQYNTNDKTQMRETTMTREKESKLVSNDDVANAKEAKARGNSYVQQQKWMEASREYTKSIELTEGRIDLLPNYEEVLALRLAAFLNRTLCHLKVNKWDEAKNDAMIALEIDSSNMKAYYRLALANIGDHDFDAASSAINKFVSNGGSIEEAKVIRDQISHDRIRYKDEEKKKFSKLFSNEAELQKN